MILTETLIIPDITENKSRVTIIIITALNKITTNTINESVCELYLSNGITYYINFKKGQIMPS